MEKSYYWSFTPCYRISSHIKLHDMIWYDSACTYNRKGKGTWYPGVISCDRSVNQSDSQWVSASVSQSVTQWETQSVSQWLSQQVSESVSESVSQWICDWLNLPASHSIIGMFTKIALSNNYVWLIYTSLHALMLFQFQFQFQFISLFILLVHVLERMVRSI